jgi:hypothetical protein
LLISYVTTFSPKQKELNLVKKSMSHGDGTWDLLDVCQVTYHHSSFTNVLCFSLYFTSTFFSCAKSKKHALSGLLDVMERGLFFISTFVNMCYSVINSKNIGTPRDQTWDLIIVCRMTYYYNAYSDLL